MSRLDNICEVSVELITIGNSESSMTSSSDEDMGLVVASKRGDVSAFEELVTRYDRKLFRVAQSVTHNPEDAKEVVQTAFFKAYQNLSRFQGNAKFSTWLIRITLNESFMKLRKQRAVSEESMNDDHRVEDAPKTHVSRSRVLVDVSDWATSPESLYSRVEFRRILRKTLRKLRPALRVVFVLRDIEGHSIVETSGILNLTTTAVKTRLSRARLQLREELTPYFKKQSKLRVAASRGL